MTDPDPRIVHVASELSVPLGPQAVNEGNLEYITDVIDAVDYANEQCGQDYKAGYGAAMDDGWGEPGHIKTAVEDERKRITQAIRNYYAVAPLAAEPLLEFIEKETT